MTRRITFTLALLVGGLGGCTVPLQEGFFACDRDDECPPGFSCLAGRCYSPGNGPMDAQVRPDGGPMNDDGGGMLDGGQADGGPDGGGSECDPPCGAGRACCDGVCRAIDVPARCGACDRICPDPVNADGTCVELACSFDCRAGFADCDGDPANGCEADLRAATSCGSCDVACGEGRLCDSSSGTARCVLDCPEGTLECSESCVDTQTDVQHCGGCGMACPRPANGAVACVEGRCVASCDEGFGDCNDDAASSAGDGCETDLLADVDRCGSCTNACANLANSTRTCDMGVCGFTCEVGFDDCDAVPDNGCEANLAAPSSCGSCALTCAGATPLCDLSGATATCLADCTGDTLLCGTSCVDVTGSVSHCGGCDMACPIRSNASRTCIGGACGFRCSSGFGDCDADPENGCEEPLSTNVNRCGACDTVCPSRTNATRNCTAGVCGFTCSSGFDNCDGNPDNGCEANIQADLDRCGSCMTVCPTRANASRTCVSGSCGFNCNAGFANCDGNPENGCEVNTQTNVDRCGSCSTVCPDRPRATRTCAAGVCGFTCEAGFADCNGMAADGCEVDTQTDVDRCGGCSTVCPTRANATRTCASGSCGYACLPGFSDCNGLASDGCEVELATSVSHCGECNNACPPAANATRTCAGGTCGFACNPGFADCNGNPADGCEVNLATNTSHCGMCNNVCTTAAFAVTGCASGMCSLACQAGRGDCNTDLGAPGGNGCEVDLATNASHCGMCGRVCTVANGTPSCSAGTCGIASCNTGYANCDGAVANGCEVDLNSDVSNCGGCGDACPTAPFAVPSCSGAGCSLSCQADRADCNGDLGSPGSDGCETNLLVDPTALDIFPASGSLTYTTRPSFVVLFDQPIDTSSGIVVLDRSVGGPLEYDLGTNPPEVTFHDGGREMRIRPNLYFERGETVGLQWTELRQATGCNRLIASPTSWSVTVSACAPGEGGVVGTAIRTTSIPGFPTFPEQYVVADTDPEGWVYIGNPDDLFRVRKTVPMFENVRSAAGLSAGQIGSSMLVNGSHLYTLNDFLSGSGGVLWRISETGGASWTLDDYATFAPLPSGQPRDVATLVPGPTSASESPIHVMFRPSSGGMHQFYSVAGNDVAPQAATQDVVMSVPTPCSGLVVDAEAYYLACPSGVGIIRVDRATGSFTTVWGGYPPSGYSSSRNALAGHDLDGNGLVDVLYFTGLRPEVLAICHPDSGSPEVHTLGGWGGSGSASFGLSYDHVNRVLWSWHDGARGLVRIE